MPLIPPAGTPYFRDGSDHLGHADCDPCRPLPDGHPLIERRLDHRALALGYHSAEEMAAVLGNCSGSFQRPQTAAEVAAGRSPEEVARAYGYYSAREMRLCERSGRETDAEVDAQSLAAGMPARHQLGSEAALAVLDAAERAGEAVDPVCGDRSHDHSSSACLGPRRPRPVDEVHTEAELAGVRAAMEHDQAQVHEQMRCHTLPVMPGGFGAGAPVPPGMEGPPVDREAEERVFSAIFQPPPDRSNLGPLFRGGQVFTAPMNGGQFTEVGTMSEGVATYPDEALPRVHELVELAQWRQRLQDSFHGMARCACGLRLFRNPLGGGPEAARKALEDHIEEERVAWAENALTRDLRARLQEVTRDVVRFKTELEEAREDVERRAAMALRAAGIQSGLREQLDTLGRVISERTQQRDVMRSEAARLRSAVSEAWTLLGSLPGTDADLIHEQVARIRERLKAAVSVPAEQVDGGQAEEQP